MARSAQLAGSGWEAETRLNVAVVKAGIPKAHYVIKGVQNPTKIASRPLDWVTEMGHVAVATLLYGPSLVRYALP